MFSQSLKPLVQHTINALHFARHGQTIEGEAPISGFSRLLDGLPKDQSGNVVWRLQGRQDAQGRLFLGVQADGVIVLECQRCLQALNWPVSAHNELRMLRSRSEIEARDAREAQGEASEIGRAHV